jgi:nitrogen fixation protein NifU and related proteins
MNDYKEIIIDHYKNPRNMGEMTDADMTIDEANASCGDIIKIYVRTQELKNPRTQDKDIIISDMKWQGVGCAISTAGASMLSEKVMGMNKDDLEKFGENGVVEMLGGEINAGRMKCATLAYRGLLKVFDAE